MAEKLTEDGAALAAAELTKALIAADTARGDYEANLAFKDVEMMFGEMVSIVHRRFAEQHEAEKPSGRSSVDISGPSV
ncbi:hypothetical protein [Croceicoccus sp. YJ47]|uniref:hypothetical protein n=1 Tax=Croceicoccus sp. YJ47 TaxID=2798724 RepID=UPI001920F881|nr:hypothetical protein [Croceicoccus sp. YJ47]QQN73149.1 hypothetical protein JD971_09730 [Croceicoccus sp. YJ47]